MRSDIIGDAISAALHVINGEVLGTDAYAYHFSFQHIRHARYPNPSRIRHVIRPLLK